MLGNLPIHSKLRKVDLNEVGMDYDTTSLYPSVLLDENSVFLKKEIGFSFKPHMNDVYVEAFNNRNFNQNGDESAILKIIFYNPPHLIFQLLPIKKKVEIIEVNQMRNGYFVHVLPSVDVPEIVENGERLVETYEGVVYRGNFKTSPM